MFVDVLRQIGQLGEGESLHELRGEFRPLPLDRDVGQHPQDKALDVAVERVIGVVGLEMVRSIGADHVFDYTREDFTRGGDSYDVIVDICGKPSISAFRRVLAPGGRLVLVGAGKGPVAVFGRLIGSVIRTRLLKQPIINFIADLELEHLQTLKELCESGKVTPVIDRTYPLAETAEAISYIETEKARGKVVITMPA